VLHLVERDNRRGQIGQADVALKARFGEPDFSGVKDCAASVGRLFAERC